MNRKTFTSKLLLASLAFSTFALSGCVNAAPASSPVSSSSTTSLPASSSVPVSSSTSDSSSLAAWVDYAHNGSVKLNLDYANRTFASDGVEQVTLKTCIDGDTAHFYPVSKTPVGGLDYIKARFYGIDTPESTGKVQPYGRGASDYTKAALTTAGKSGTIVLSSPSTAYGAPSADSTGSRYVSLVWINPSVKNAPFDQLYLLNLMIVQDGWSWVKNVLDMPSYSDTFYAAESQANDYKLNLFSGKPDPRFNAGNYQDVSLLELKKEVELSMADSTHTNAYDNANVRVLGTVAGFSNNVLYIEDFCLYTDADGNPLTDSSGNPTGAGEYAGINIFVGMAAIPSKYTTINTYISVCGNAYDSANFGFQISGATFPTLSYSDTDAKVLIKAEDNVEEHSLYTFSYTAAQLNAIATNTSFVYPCLNCNVSLSDNLVVTGGYVSEDGEITLNFGLSYSIYLTFQIKPDPSDTTTLWKSYTSFVGHAIKVKGVFTYHKSASNGKYYFQINPSSASDITVMDYVRVTPANTNALAVGSTLQFSAEVLPLEANANQNVTWSIVNVDGKETVYATVDETGLVTAMEAGNVKVVATSAKWSSSSTSYSLTITA